MKEFIIKENEAGQRFDKYLAKLLREAPKSFFYKMLRKKNITLNGKKATGNEKLNPGDRVKLFLSDETFQKFSKETKGIQDLPLRLLVLILAIIFTGVGASMSLSMRIVPNPGDGIVQAIADCIHKNVGFTKNCFDLFNITVTILLGLVLAGRLIGVGIGTVLAVIGVGRIIALFQHLAGEKIVALSGVEV